MKKSISIIVLLSTLLWILLGTAGCGKSYETRTKSFYEYFDTVSIISSYGDETDEGFEKICKDLSVMLESYHKLFDIYYEYSGVNNLCTVNKNAGKQPVSVCTELLDFLEYCKELFILTGGETNIAMGAVLKIWHRYRERALDDASGSSTSVPSMAELMAAAEHTSIDSIVIDREAGTVFISDPEASIDVGAIGKGYATERAAKMLLDRGVTSYVLNIGGNIRTIGEKPNSDKWVTGITNPDRSSEERFACRIGIGETSCVTSGNYERYFEHNGVRYHHIIDKDSLIPAGYFSSVTVICKDSGLADALSTALFCMNESDGRRLVQEIGGVEVLWITKDFKTSMTDGFRNLLIND